MRLNLEDRGLPAKPVRRETLEALDDEDVNVFLARLGCVVCKLYELYTRGEARLTKEEVSRLACDCSTKLDLPRGKACYPTPKFENDLRRLGVLVVGSDDEPWCRGRRAEPGLILYMLAPALDYLCPCNSKKSCIDVGAVTLLAALAEGKTTFARVAKRFTEILLGLRGGPAGLCSALEELTAHDSSMASLYLRVAQEVVTYDDSYRPPERGKVERLVEKLLEAVRAGCETCRNLPLLKLPLVLWRVCR